MQFKFDYPLLGKAEFSKKKNNERTHHFEKEPLT